MRRICMAAFALAAVTTFTTNAHAAFVLGVNFGDPSVTSDVTIDGNLFHNEATAIGLSYSADFQHFDYTAVFGLTTFTPTVPADEDAALAQTLLLPFGVPTGDIHQTVASGQAYNVTLYYIEGYADNNRSWNVSGDISGTNLGLLPYDAWTAVTFTTPVITDGSIDFTMTTLTDQPVLSMMSISTVPEPTTLSLAGIAGASLLLRRRSRV